ncbi:MAG: type VI secretion system membrane subunit TssM [Candidatus Krumholzibacteriia bacterium]
MNIIAKVFKLLFHPQSVVLLVAALLVALLLRFGGRFGVTGHLRLYIIIGIVVAALVAEVVLILRRRKQAEQVEVSLIREADASVADAGADQKRAREAARQELLAALAALKRTSAAGGVGGGAALHAMPWYMVLGADGAGKSTLVRNSGLRVPGRQAGDMKAIGASRHCEWWFTNQAVVLEADHRFADPAQAKAVERDWNAFLEQLRRIRQPALNGVIVTISAEEIGRGDGARLNAQIELLRRRLDDLSRDLRLVFPVYVVVTKVDLVPGFGDFFGDLTGAARDQIWGATLSGALMAQTTPEKLFDQEFELLYHTLLKRRLPRLVREPRPEPLPGIYLFPLEFHALRDRLRHCVKGLFATGTFEHGPLLRGLYFASGGWPVPGQAPAPACFLGNLFQNVIIPDRAVARPTAGATQRGRQLRVAGAAAVGLALLLCGVWMVSSFVGNRRLLRESQRVALDYRADPATPLTPGDLRVRLQQLDPLRRQLELLDAKDAHAGFRLGLGLYQGRELNRQARRRYLDGLERALVRSSRDGLERRLAAPEARSSWDAFYEPYVAYRMLCDPTLGEAPLLAAQLGRLWTGVGAEGGELATLIREHVAYAWSHKEDLAAYRTAPSSDLAYRLRSLWEASSGEDRLFTTLTAAADQAVDPFTLASVPGAPLVLVAADGAPQGPRVEGAFTAAGWDNIRASLARTGNQPLPAWLLADLRGSGRVNADPSSFLSWYANQYIDRWNRFLAGVSVSRQGGLLETVNRLEDLARDDSPFYRLLEEVQRNVDFDSRLKGDDRTTYARLLDIDAAFATLRAFVRKAGDVGPDGSRAGDYRAMLTKLAAKLAELRGAGDIGRRALELTREIDQKPDSEDHVFGHLQGIANRFCGESRLGGQASNEALRTYLRGPARVALRACRGESYGRLDDSWQRQVLEPYRALASKYPFDRTSRVDVTVDEFGRFFGGARGTLKVFVDRELPQYAAQGDGGAGGGDAGLGPELKQALDAAAAIRRAFGLENADEPRLAFDIRPRQVTPPAQFSSLKIGNSPALEYSSGSGGRKWWPYQWPDLGGVQAARVALHLSDGSEPENAQDGVWSFFRLLDAATVTPQDGGLYRLEWALDDGGGHSQAASYDLQPRSRDNPFAPGFFGQFKLPAALGQ